MQFDMEDTKERCQFLGYHSQSSKLRVGAVPLVHNLEQTEPMAWRLII